ncbi:helix-turn-helix transcriptional regulator [Ensifer soli]|uniref:helix-turn-helix transcriptional regulator n=1 Tax=Ciceribacter sp. sgz301302 TaxID=3342379 RepID=UPI0035B96C37
MNADLSIVDHIYEAAFLPDQWSVVCERLCEEAGAYSAAVVAIDEWQTFRWIATPNIAAVMERYALSPMRLQNSRPQRHVERGLMSFSRDIDLMSPAELAADPIYEAFLHPLGLGWTVGDLIQEPSGHAIMFDLTRKAAHGPFTEAGVARLNALRPDLARAALMSSRLAFQRARTVAETLDAIGLPAAVVGDSGAAVALNGRMEDLAPRIRTGARNRLTLDSADANGLLQMALAQLRESVAPFVQSIPIAAAAEGPALILHLLPVRRQARDIFSRSAAILIVTPVGAVGPPDLRVISGLFDLTAAEARVAREIAIGTSIDAAAQKLGIARETVRTNLKRIFMKTGTGRQSELVMLLSGLGRLRN